MSTHIIECDQAKVEKRHARELATLRKDGCTVYIEHLAPSFNAIYYVGLDGNFYHSRLRGRSLARWEVQREASFQALDNCRMWMSGRGRQDTEGKKTAVVLQVHRLAFERNVTEFLGAGIPRLLLSIERDRFSLPGEADLLFEVPAVKEQLAGMADEDWAEWLSHESAFVREKAMLACAQAKSPPKQEARLR